MFKVTPNPPVTDPASPYESPDSKKLHEAAERALDHYLGPPTAEIMAAPYKPNALYIDLNVRVDYRFSKADSGRRNTRASPNQSPLPPGGG